MGNPAVTEQSIVVRSVGWALVESATLVVLSFITLLVTARLLGPADFGLAASVIAIDPNREAIARLAGRFPMVDARAVAFDDFELPPHTVDVALFAWSL